MRILGQFNASGRGFHAPTMFLGAETLGVETTPLQNAFGRGNSGRGDHAPTECLPLGAETLGMETTPLQNAFGRGNSGRGDHAPTECLWARKLWAWRPRPYRMPLECLWARNDSWRAFCLLIKREKLWQLVETILCRS